MWPWHLHVNRNMAVHSEPLPHLPWNGQEKHGAFHPARCQPKGLAWLENLARHTTRSSSSYHWGVCTWIACMRAFRGDKSQGHIWISSQMSSLASSPLNFIISVKVNPVGITFPSKWKWKILLRYQLVQHFESPMSAHGFRIESFPTFFASHH